MEKLMVKCLLILSLLFSTAYGQSRRHVISGGGSATIPDGLVYNIKNYGAVASEVTSLEGRVPTTGNKINATTAMQAAINACHAAGGGVVYIPPGHYYISQVESYTDVTIKGSGFVSSYLHALSDTMIAIHNLPPALAVTFNSSLTNMLAEDVRFNGDSIAKVGLYVDRGANFNINRNYFEHFTEKAMILRNTLVGAVSDCRFYRNRYGIFGFADGTNHTATTQVRISGCVINLNRKWAIDWSGGGNLVIDFGDFEANGVAYDTATGAIYYHDNGWTKGLTVRDTWFEENHGQEIFIGPNVTRPGLNYPSFITHYIMGINAQGHQYNWTNRNIYVKGANQRVAIYSSSIFGANNYNNIVVDGTNNRVITYASVFDSLNANVVRGNGNSIINN